MPFANLKQSAHLRLLRVADPDQFQAIGFLDIERQALLGPYCHRRAITALPGVLLILEQTSPRSLSAMMYAMGCTVIVPMGPQGETVFNAQAWSASEVGLLRSEILFDAREPAPNTFAVIRFSSDMQNRGWEESDGKLHLHNASDEHLSRLQRVIRNILALCSSPIPRLEFGFAAEALRHELIDALDHVLVSRKARRASPRAFERHCKLVSRLDDFARSHPETPLYSDALAHELGTSIRTLQLAVNAVHGASLHQHLRNRRLWSLRAQLAKGMPMTSVSSAAFANGFFHMGELAHSYKATFGELPSETLLRSKRF
ncbi:AraC family transcriptional regulator [Bradyrhizobium diazoefficiens]|nr:AraC family transcriptional regulator [Bradyrhizobium diazoefficiens]MBR0778687.1 AraC family transcriptional regulator [Bradyrhizobium diazoefficiens]MBR0848034.1 AraC family transcriptional regulator [Bradyrhizobium diazoefficiens]